eukprot:GHVT01091211.1.p1 GENE.GHVT01091211.1~~GHVT01091211.1.p1  ORF type:complete len:104 (+),score=17.20 GHVT01091211.1:78-389(+)
MNFFCSCTGLARSLRRAESAAMVSPVAPPVAAAATPVAPTAVHTHGGRQRKGTTNDSNPRVHVTRIFAANRFPEQYEDKSGEEAESEQRLMKRHKRRLIQTAV